MSLRRLLIAITVLVLWASASASTPRSASAQAGCGPNTVHIVQRGQTLFRIALSYGSNVNTLRAVNNIANINRIYVGQRLLVPCPSQVVVGTPNPAGGPSSGVVNPYVGPGVNIIIAPPTPAPITVSQPAGQVTVNCVTFRGTSPLDGLAFGENVFYWNGAAGATGYRVNVYNLDAGGGLVASADVGLSANSARLDVGGGAGAGYRFAWEVQALVSGFATCTTGRYSMFRASLPPAFPTAVPTAIIVGP